MAIEAPLSKFKKNNLRIYIAVCIGLALWCAYDGYLNKEWIEEHTNEDGSAQTYLVFNRNAPIYFGVGAVLIGAYFFSIKNRKVVADENELIIDDKKKIAYDNIQKIDKSNFKSNGYFIITHNDEQGVEQDCRLSDKNYDNLSAVLDYLIEKIS